MTRIILLDVIANAHSLLISKILFIVTVLGCATDCLGIRKRTFHNLLLIIGFGSCSVISFASNDPQAWAQEVSGTLDIEFGNAYTTNENITVELICSSTLGSDCIQISITFENNDANLDSDNIDVIPNINVSSTTDSALMFAYEDDLNAGIFTIVFDNNLADSFIPSISFVDDELITISDLPLSSENGEKTVSAIFFNNFDQMATADDTIILDTLPPETPTLFEPENELYTNETTPTFDWADAVDANPIAFYVLEIDNEESFTAPLIISAIVEFSSSSELDLNGIPLDDGAYYWRVSAVDVAGNRGQFSEIFLFHIDTTAPPAPVIVYPQIGSTIHETNLTINGTSEPLSTVYVFEGDVILGNTISNRTGEWSLDPFSLDYASHQITAVAQDRAGNRSPSTAIIFTIELAIPTPASITIDSSSNLQPKAGTDSVTIFGSVQMTTTSSVPIPIVLVDWDDGTTHPPIKLTESSWNATHSYSSDQSGLKRIVARLIVDDVEQAISAPFEIILQAPPGQQPSGFSPGEESILPIIIAGILVPAAILGLRFYKSKSKQRLSAQNIRLAFDYGAGNENKALASQSKVLSNEGLAELEQSWKATLTNALTQIRETLSQAKQITDVANFCMEAKEDPDTFFSRISNMALVKMLEYIQPLYSKMFIDDIRVHCDIEVLGKNKHATSDININIRPIEPYIEVALLISETKTSVLRLTFKIDSEVNINKMEVSPSSDGIRMGLENVTIKLQFSLQKISVIHMNKPISPGTNDNLLRRTVELWAGKFEVKGLSITEESASEKLIVSTTDSVAPEVKEIVCVACQKRVLANMFCPECGATISR